jgi:hypothetical protein
MGAFQGDFSSKSAHDLGAVAIQAAVERPASTASWSSTSISVTA